VGARRLSLFGTNAHVSVQGVLEPGAEPRLAYLVWISRREYLIA